MKIGNLSLTFPKVPQFFMYKNMRKIDAFTIRHFNRIYSEKRLLSSMNQMNFNNNFRCIACAIDREEPPTLMKKFPPIALQLNHKKRQYDSKSVDEMDCIKKNRRNSNNDTVNKIPKAKVTSPNKDEMSMKKSGSIKSYKLPRCKLMDTDFNQALYLMSMDQRGIYNQKDMFRQTLIDKVMTMKSISNKIKLKCLSRNEIMEKEMKHLNINMDESKQQTARTERSRHSIESKVSKESKHSKESIINK